jgi:outer membrane protease
MVRLLRAFYPQNWKKNKSILSFIIAAIFAVPAFGENIYTDADKKEIKTKTLALLDLENGFDRYFCYTRYRIGGKIVSREGCGIYHFPLSELEFPLNVFTIYANLNLTLVDRLTFHFGVRKNLHSHAGKMKDSDWYPYPNIKTIYSESDARINSVFTDADLIVRLFTVSFFSLKFGAGFLHQYMSYSCSNVEQFSILPASDRYIKILGKILTYEVQYYILTLQTISVFRVFNGLEITLAMRFSPYLTARDIDDHILRSKKSRGASKGLAVLPGFRIRYSFPSRVFIAARLDYLYLNTKGKQKQTYYLPTEEANYLPGWSAEVDTKLQSQQLSVSLGAGYSFEF